MRNFLIKSLGGYTKEEYHKANCERASVRFKNYVHDGLYKIACLELKEIDDFIKEHNLEDLRNACK